MTTALPRSLQQELTGRAALTEETVRAALTEHGAFRCGPRTVDVTEDGLLLVERERRHSVTFADLAEIWSDRLLDIADTAALTSRVVDWQQGRPCTTYDAEHQGFPSLQWDDLDDEPSWQVVVVRDRHMVSWTPLFTDGRELVESIRQASYARASTAQHHRRTFGGITAWTHKVHPGLSANIIVDNEWRRDQVRKDSYIVFTPNANRPVLTCGEAEAERLIGTIRQPVYVRHASELKGFRWR